MGKNGGYVGMNLIGNSGKPITEDYIEKFGVEAYAEFNKDFLCSLTWRLYNDYLSFT